MQSKEELKEFLANNGLPEDLQSLWHDAIGHELFLLGAPNPDQPTGQQSLSEWANEKWPSDLTFSNERRYFLLEFRYMYDGEYNTTWLMCHNFHLEKALNTILSVVMPRSNIEQSYSSLPLDLTSTPTVVASHVAASWLGGIKPTNKQHPKPFDVYMTFRMGFNSGKNHKFTLAQAKPTSGYAIVGDNSIFNSHKLIEPESNVNIACYIVSGAYVAPPAETTPHKLLEWIEGMQFASAGMGSPSSNLVKNISGNFEKLYISPNDHDPSSCEDCEDGGFELDNDHVREKLVGLFA